MIRAIRVLLGLVGVAAVGVGLLSLVRVLTPLQLLGLAVWLACAVVLHDGVWVPTATALGALLARVGRPLPRGALAVVRGGLAVGGALTLVTVPELVAQARGNPNPTVLPQPYLAHLAWLWLGIVVVVALGVGLSVWRERRSAVHPSTSSR